MLKNPFSSSKRGFTLIEVTVVVGIIGILVSIAIAAGSSAKKSAQDKQRKSDISLLQIKLEMYRDQYGFYPDALDNGSSPKTLTHPGAAGTDPSIISSSAMSKDPTTKAIYNYIPFMFTGGTCGDSYYLWAVLTIEKNTNHITDAKMPNLGPCAGTGPKPALTDSIYDVTSPNSMVP